MRGVKPLTSALFLFSTLVLPGGVQGNAWAQQNPLPAPRPRMLLGVASAPAGLNALGRLPARQRLNLAITLRLRDQEELRGLLQDIYNPASVYYQHYLSVEEFTERFGPTAEDYERVLEFARSSGLAVTHTSANRLVVDVNGAVGDIERTFGVRMHVYRHPVERRTFYAPDVEPSVDASLPIQGVAGLSTLNMPHPASPRPVLSPIPQLRSGGSASNGGFTASDLRAAYIPGVTLTGAGQSVGLFEMNGYNLSDIQAYFSSLGESLSVPILNVLVDGVSGTCGVSCDDGEQALDIEMALALAPGLSAVIVYEGETPADILNQMAADNLAKQLSCSYVFLPDPALYEPFFLEFEAQGQSFFASSGDGGAYSPPDCVSNCWTSRFPADDPYVTAVGGTELATNGPGGAWVSETTWASSGGGINSYGYPIASYQAPLINVLNQGSSTLRNIPDVAAVASNVYVQANGSAGSSGGTSASAPLWASFTALVNQQSSGAPVGFLNPLIYPLALTAGYVNDFHDITSGNNFDSYSPDLFSAVTGYDLVTGLGSPNGQDLINALAPVNTGANFTLLSSSPTLIVAQGAQGTAQITLQAVNGFNGTVNLGYVVVGQPTGLTASLSPSSISGAADSTLTVSASTATSSPSAMVAITGTSGGLTQSLYIPVTVLLPSLVETGVSAPPPSVTRGATFSVTDTVQNSGQAAAGSSVTAYYLSDAPSKNGLALLLGSRTVPALAAAATSSATVSVTVPAGIWPNTPYYLLACANDTNSVAEATSGNCLASSTTTIFNLSKTATTTSLTLTSSGAIAISVASGALVTLTASVVAGSTPVSPGQVSFCDATAAHCTDIHLLGTAQLTPGGTATLRIVPGVGNHSYRAVFAGTTGYAASTSANAALQVTGTHATTTTVAKSGSAGDYSLSATVTGVGGLLSPGGSLSFLDTSNSNASLGGVTLAAGAPSLGWLAAPSPATGADPQGVAAADFNGDGIPDLAIANRNDFTVTILLGNGDGTFRQSAVIPNIYSAQAIAVADFNGDGIPDLAVTNSGWNSLTILLGNGNGTFTPVAGVLSTGVLPAALAVADLNGDGIPDLAVANYGDTVLSIFLGNGDGTFTTAPVVQLSGTAQGVAAGDFNHDGRMDLAVAAAGPSTEMVEVLLGNGDGTFTPSGSTLSVGSYPSAIVSADFDGDGKPDLAVTIAFSDTLAVFLGNGDGTFRPAAASPETGNYPLSLVTADVNGDGIPDLAVGNDGSSTLTILFGNGDGTFTAASTNVATGNSPISIAAADFNGDGFPDLVAANQLDNTASVFLTQLTWTATATVNGVNPSGAGNHLVDASYGGDSNYSASISTTVALQTGAAVGLPAPPSFPSESVGITSPPQSVTVTNTGGANLTFTAIGVTGPFAISPTGTTCSISSPVGAPGNCTVAITFTPTAAGAASGSLSFTDNAPGSPQSVSLSGSGTAPLVVTASSASMTYGGTVPTITPGYSGFVNEDTAANLTTQPTCTTTATSHSPVGSYPTTCSGAVDSIYSFTYVAGNVIIGTASLTITAGSTIMTYGATPPAVTPGYSAFAGSDTVNSLTTAPTCVTSASNSTPVGMDTGANTCSGAVDGNYNFNYVPGNVTVGKASLTITAGNTIMTYGATPPAVTPGYSAFAGSDTVNSLTTTPTCSTSATISTPVGTDTGANTCSGAVDGNYNFNYVPGNVTVGKAPLTITASSGTMTYGATVPTITPGYSAFAGSDTVNSLTTQPTCSTTATSQSPAASYPSTCSGAADSNYTIGYVAGTVTDSAAGLTITANNTARAYSAANPTFTVTYVGLVNSDVPSSLTGTLSCTTTATATSPAATYPITCSGQSSTNYTIGYVAGTLTVNPAAVAAASPSSLTFSSENVGTTSASQPVALNNTGDAALTITNIAANGNFAETNNCGTSVAAGGSCTINVTFTPTAPGSLSGSLTITDNSLGVTGSTQSVALSGTGQDFSFAPSAGSPTSLTAVPGQAVNYTLSVGGEGGLSGTVTFTCAGAPSAATCTITPNPVTAGSAPTSVTVMVTTTAASSVAPRSRHIPPLPFLSTAWRNLLLFALILAVMAWTILRRKRAGVGRWQPTLMPLAAGLLLTLALAGCGGGGGGVAGGGTTSNPGTPAGNYTLTVTGTSGSGSSAVSHSVTLTLIVS